MRGDVRLQMLLALAMLPATGCWSSVGGRLHFNLDQHARPGFGVMFYSELGLGSESCPLNRREQQINHWLGLPLDILSLKDETTVLTASLRYRVLLPVGEVRSSDGNTAPIDLMANARAGFGGTVDSDVPNLMTVGGGGGAALPPLFAGPVGGRAAGAPGLLRELRRPPVDRARRRRRR